MEARTAISRCKEWKQDLEKKEKEKRENREGVEYIESLVESIYSLVIQHIDGFQILSTSYMGHRYFTWVCIFS